MLQQGCVFGLQAWLSHDMLGICGRHRPSLSGRLFSGGACVGPDVDHVAHGLLLFAEPYGGYGG